MSCFHVFCLLFCKDSKNVCNPADSTQFFCNFLSKILTKTCRGKVMKEKLKTVKVILHFARAKLSHCETLALTAPKTMFHRTKHHLSHDETWSFVQRNLTSRKFVFCKPPVYSLKSV